MISYSKEIWKSHIFIRVNLDNEIACVFEMFLFSKMGIFIKENRLEGNAKNLAKYEKIKEVKDKQI